MSAVNSLALHERIFFNLFFSLVLVLSIHALSAPQERWPGNKKEKCLSREQVVILVSGEVERSGRYHFNRGTSMRQALKEISLNEGAKTEKLPLDRCLKAGQKIKIGKQSKTVVRK